MSDERRTTQIFGTYVVWGPEREPEVHTLDEPSYRRYRNWPARRGAVAIAAAFGTGMDTAIPAWSAGAMELIALNYEGPHQVRVRGLCAAILLGKPYGGPEPGDGPQGGSKDRVPDQPKSPRGPHGGHRTFGQFLATREAATATA
jgi:hypothetical protein